MTNNTQIDIYFGDEASPYRDAVIQFRLDAFKEYPYLYVGNVEQEQKYVQQYISDSGIITIVRINGTIAAIGTGIAFSSESEITHDLVNVFTTNGIDTSQYYYYGEIIVLPQFRKMGIMKAIFAAQDAWVQSCGFTHVCFMSVSRDHDHPLRPADYHDNDAIWPKFGFEKNNFSISLSWPTIQPDKKILLQENHLAIWSKRLDTNSSEELLLKQDSLA